MASGLSYREIFQENAMSSSFLAVFDLDYTVWHPEMYQLYSEPVLVEASDRISQTVREEAKTKDPNKILVSSGSPIRVFSGASYALADINRLNKEAGSSLTKIQAAVASRTDEPHYARICMDNLVCEDGTTLTECFGNRVEISYQNKTHHFRRLKEKTGIPFEQMGKNIYIMML